MSDVGIALRNILMEDVDVGALVGIRVGPSPLAQTPEKDIEGKLLEAITYGKASGPRLHDIDISYPRYQVTAWASTYTKARALAKTIIECLQRYKKEKNGVKITQMVVLNDFDLRDPVTGYYTVPVDVRINYRED